MRELAKSLVSYGWAVSIYGVQQMASAVTLGGSAPGKAGFPGSVASAITEMIGLAGRAAVDAGTAITGAAFGLVTGGGGAQPQPPVAPPGAGATAPGQAIVPAPAWSWADSQAPEVRRRPGIAS